MRHWILIIIAVNVLGLIGLAFAYPELMIAPGPLMPAHASLTTNCFACHAPLQGTSATRCITCHAVADIGLRTTKGLPLTKPAVKNPFHQELTATDCVACHNDHLGAKSSGQSRKPFSHALLRTASRDNCQTCHTAPKTAVHSAGATNCVQCHQRDRWKPAAFDHAKFFELTGDHNAPCATCHVGGDTTKYTCYGCHEHQPDRIRSKHIKEGIPNFENCVRCHRSARGEHEGGGDGRKGGERD